MQQRFLLYFFLFLTISFELNASDTLQFHSNNNKKFTIGVSVSLISSTIWTKTDSLIVLIDHKPSNKDIRASFLNSFGVSFAYKLNKYFSVETGANYNQQYLFELADHWPDPKSGGGQNLSLTYKANYLQIPISVSFITQRKHSVYVNLGLKSNFIYNEHLYGNEIKYITYPTVPPSPNQSTAIAYSIDISDKNLKFTSIIPTRVIFSKPHPFRVHHFSSIKL